jgi:hypothetical protein
MDSSIGEGQKDARYTKLLYEDDVVDAVCRYLKRNGYVIRQSLTVVERGHDIIASKKSQRQWDLYIEAKGQGSSKSSTARYGSAFSSSQVFTHVAKAVLKALRITSKEGRESQARAGIALPRTLAHQKEIDLVSPALRQAGVAVFWVDDKKRVHVDSSWDV